MYYLWVCKVIIPCKRIGFLFIYYYSCVVVDTPFGLSGLWLSHCAGCMVMLSVGFVNAGVGFGNGCFMVGYEVVFLLVFLLGFCFPICCSESLFIVVQMGCWLCWARWRSEVWWWLSDEGCVRGCGVYAEGWAVQKYGKL